MAEGRKNVTEGHDSPDLKTAKMNIILQCSMIPLNGSPNLNHIDSPMNHILLVFIIQLLTQSLGARRKCKVVVGDTLFFGEPSVQEADELAIVSLLQNQCPMLAVHPVCHASPHTHQREAGSRQK